MSNAFVSCPSCHNEWKEEVELQEPEPDVGIHGSAALGEGIKCPECDHEFTAEEIEAEETRIYEAETSDDDPWG